jgi:hypothetical protein
MTGVRLVGQEVASAARRDAVVRGPGLDAVRCRPGLPVTRTGGDHPGTVTGVVDRTNTGRPQESVGSGGLASARERTGAIGAPSAVWYGPEEVR